MKLKAKIATTALALAIPMGVSVAIAAPANAAESCGSGYKQVKAYPITVIKEKGGHGTAIGGYVTLYYQSASGRACAIARPNKTWRGKVDYLGVEISQTYHGKVWKRDFRNNHVYAGPVSIPAKGKCVTLYAHLRKKKDSTQFSTYREHLHC